MTSYRHDAWEHLRGALVQVRKNGTVLREGLVEDVMPDSSALWIAADGLAGQVLIEAAEGHEVWVEPRQLEGKRAYRMTLSALQRGEGDQVRGMHLNRQAADESLSRGGRRWPRTA